MADIPYTTTGRAAVAVDGYSAARIGYTTIRWGSVIAGVAGAVSVQCLLTVLGIALGLSTVSAGTHYEPGDVTGISAAAAGWWLISGCAALMLGGMIVGCTSGLVRGNQLHVNAFTMWAVTAVFGFVVLWSGATTASNSAMYAMATTDVAAPSIRGVPSAAGDARIGNNVIRSADTPAVTRDEAERAVRLARTASWWSVFGLLAGCAATLAGAWLAVPPFGLGRRVS